MRSDDGLDISAYSGQQCTRIKSYPTWTPVHIRSILTVIFMDNGRDRFETDINQKTGRKLSVHCKVYRGAWVSANGQGTGGITGSCFNINGIFQDQAVREKWIYPESSGISKSNRNSVMEVRHE